MAEQRFASKTFYLFGGLLIWAAHFMLVYSVNAVACVFGFAKVQVIGADLVPFTVILATLVALASAGYLLLSMMAWQGPLRGEARTDPSTIFLRQVTIALTLLAMIAILLSALPSLIVPPCG